MDNYGNTDLERLLNVIRKESDALSKTASTEDDFSDDEVQDYDYSDESDNDMPAPALTKQAAFDKLAEDGRAFGLLIADGIVEGLIKQASALRVRPCSPGVPDGGSTSAWLKGTDKINALFSRPNINISAGTSNPGDGNIPTNGPKNVQTPQYWKGRDTQGASTTTPSVNEDPNTYSGNTKRKGSKKNKQY